MCHNILLPSKGSNEWRNIPLFLLVVIAKGFIEFIFVILSFSTYFHVDYQFLWLWTVFTVLVLQWS